MVVTPTLSRINHTIRRTVNYLKYAPWRFARFTIRSRFRAFIVSARRIKSSSDSKSLSFFDTSIRINLDLIKTHACERLIGYQFKEPLLLWEALQPAGPLDGMPQMPRYEDGNKRLAIVGDRVLALLLALKWYPSWGMRSTFVFRDKDWGRELIVFISGVRDPSYRYIIQQVARTDGHPQSARPLHHPPCQISRFHGENDGYDSRSHHRSRLSRRTTWRCKDCDAESGV